MTKTATIEQRKHQQTVPRILLVAVVAILSCCDAASAFMPSSSTFSLKKYVRNGSNQNGKEGSNNNAFQLHSANSDNGDLKSSSISSRSSSTVSTTTSSQTVSSYTKLSQSSTFHDMNANNNNGGDGGGGVVLATAAPTAATEGDISTVEHDADVDVGVDTNTEIDIDSMNVASERQLLEQCLDYQAYTLGPTHIETMKTLHNLATFMYQHSATHTPPSSSVQQEKDQSKKLYFICYNQQKHHLGQFHSDTLLTLYNLFIIYYNEGDYDVVKHLIFDDVLSKSNDAAHGGTYYMDWTILDTMLNLAFTYHCGEIESTTSTTTNGGEGGERSTQEVAMKLYESFLHSFYDYTTALTQKENEHIEDPTHPNHYRYQDVLSVQHNLGVLYQNTGDYVKARKVVEECYNSRVAALGRSHHLTLGTMNNLAALCHKMGEYSRARTLYCECYDLKKECLGVDHLDTELTLRNIQRLKEMYSFEE